METAPNSVYVKIIGVSALRSLGSAVATVNRKLGALYRLDVARALVAFNLDAVHWRGLPIDADPYIEIRDDRRGAARAR